MTQQAQATIIGHVGSQPRKLGNDGSAPTCTFRLASTRRYFNRSTNAWQEAPTTWMNVRAYRGLAINVMDSLHVGDPVIVTGTLALDEWEKDGQQRSAIAVEASCIGHDLNRGRTTFERVASQQLGTSRGTIKNSSGSTRYSSNEPLDEFEEEPEESEESEESGEMPTVIM